jgi:hypothetical protein
MDSRLQPALEIDRHPDLDIPASDGIQEPLGPILANNLGLARKILQRKIDFRKLLEVTPGLKSSSGDETTG